MKLIQYECESPEENIAFDEVLFQAAEQGRLGEALRFWEGSGYFVVLGKSGKIKEECLIEKCRKDNVKILRRISGGGTVLQGPGCVNYSLILSYGRDKHYKNIISSYKSILNGIAGRFLKEGINLEYFPISDLAVNKKKISGNAQARKKSFFLHHGTFLLSFDIERVSRYINHPVKEPGYREKRKHEDFMANLDMPRDEFRRIMGNIFISDTDAAWKPDADFIDKLKALVRTKYTKDEWNRRF